MARPMGVAKATKDNSNKHPQQHEEFTEGKKIGRPKQQWVEETVGNGLDAYVAGHWEKIQ